MVEFIQASTALVDLGWLLVLGMLAYGMYQLVRIIRANADSQVRMHIVERLAIDKWAKDRGHDLIKEIGEVKILEKLVDKKDFQTRVKNEVFDSYFKDVKKK